MVKSTIYQRQFESNLDFPRINTPEITYILCSTPRCGSHLLGHTLYKTGQLGWPLEYFNPVNLPVWQQRFQTQGLQDTFAAIQQHRTSPNGCFGCKLHYDHFAALTQSGQFEQLFPNIVCIFMRRRDIVSQAVSWAKAASTGSWIAEQPAFSTAHYNRQDVESKLQKIILDNAQWLYVISRRSWPVLEVFYEDFVENPEQTIVSVFDFLNIEPDASKSMADFSLPVRQGGKTNADWKQAYLTQVSQQNFYADANLINNRSLGTIPTSTLLKEVFARVKGKLSSLETSFGRSVLHHAES